MLFAVIVILLSCLSRIIQLLEHNEQTEETIDEEQLENQDQEALEVYL